VRRRNVSHPFFLERLARLNIFSESLTLFVREQGSERLIALVEPLTQGRKFLSNLSGIEVHSAIRGLQTMDPA
jgi:hypothetical protein